MDRQRPKWNRRTVTTGGPFLLIVIALVGFLSVSSSHKLPLYVESDVISYSLIYPVVSGAIYGAMSRNGGFNLGGINATGQIMEGRFSLIDKDTPRDVYTKTSPYDGRQLQLVFSDEFNVDGRTFWPGDDPFWEAVDLWYWYEFELPFWNSLSDPFSGRHRTSNGERSGGRLGRSPKWSAEKNSLGMTHSRWSRRVGVLSSHWRPRFPRTIMVYPIKEA